MILYVVSDSHFHLIELNAAAARFSDADVIAHLGDGASDAKRLRALTGKRVLSVRGNWDGASDGPEEMIERLDGVDVLLCHGHRYRVHDSLMPLSLRAREARVAMAMFGHTHTPYCGYAYATLLLNPGALKDDCYARVEINGEKLRPELLRL